MCYTRKLIAVLIFDEPYDSVWHLCEHHFCAGCILSFWNSFIWRYFQHGAKSIHWKRIKKRVTQLLYFVNLCSVIFLVSEDRISYEWYICRLAFFFFSFFPFSFFISPPFGILSVANNIFLFFSPEGSL